MTLEFDEWQDRWEDPEKFVASIDRKPKKLVRVVLEKIFPKLTTTNNWEEPQQRDVEELSIDIE